MSDSQPQSYERQPQIEKPKDATLLEINERQKELVAVLSPSRNRGDANEEQEKKTRTPMTNEEIAAYRREQEKNGNVFYVGANGKLFTSEDSARRLGNTKQAEGVKKTEIVPINAVVERPWEYTSEQWRRELLKIPDFNGDIEKAVFLLQQFSAGMERVVRDWNKDQETNYKTPLLRIYFGKNVQQTGIHFDPDHNDVVIGRDFLANLTNFNQTDLIKLYSSALPGRQLQFVGKIGDYIRLAGVEETNHSERKQRVGNVEPTLANIKNLTLLSEYDAQDTEYEALLVQLKDSQEQKMPRETIAHLQKRINLARVVRREKGLEV